MRRSAAISRREIVEALPGPAIHINGRSLDRPISGVERYAVEVAARLGEDVTTLRPSRPGRVLSGHLWEQWILPRRLGPTALLWSPANTGPLRVGRQVVTIHDVSPLDHPEWFQPHFAALYRWLLPRLAGKVTRIITDSQFSRDRIVARLGVRPEKIVVVPPGVAPPFAPVPPDEQARVQMEYRLTSNYLLAVGSIEPRKNLGTIVQAWEAIRPRYPGLQLVLAGERGSAFKDPDLGELPADVRRLGRVPDEDLPGLYGGAAVSLTLSLYEGFGLTALEAMACGTPVLASAAGALPEIVGEAGLVVDPRRLVDVSRALESLLEDEARRDWLGAIGRQRALEYSWERTAAGVRRVLDAATGG